VYLDRPPHVVYDRRPVRVQPTGNRITGSAPLDPAQAHQALDEAADREQIFSVLLRAARSRVPFAALLSVHRDGFRGRRAIAGDRFDGSTVGDLLIPRDAVPSFELAVSTRSPYLGPIATDAPEISAQLQRLGGMVPPVALVLPIVLAERAVALVVGHRGDQPLALDEVADLFPLVSETGRVLARMLARRAEAAAEKPKAGGSLSGLSSTVTESINEVEAQRRVIAVCREYESWSELADALRALLRSGLERGEPDEDEQLELLFELGRVEAQRLGRPDLAVEAWRSAQTINAADPRVSEELERLLVTLERWGELADLLERRAALAEDQQERVFVLLNLATVARERLLDDARAIETYERIRSWAPAHELAAQKLEELYRAHGRWEPLVALLVDRADLETAAQIYEQQLDDPRAAFLVWLTLLRREPRRPGGLEALEQLGAAAAAWNELLPECEALAGALDSLDGEAAARLWRQLGRWKRDHLGLRQESAEAFDHALRHAPEDSDTLDELLELRRELGPWKDLATALSRRAALDLDPVRRSERLVELGRVYETRLDQPGEAVAAYEDAVAADPPCRAALVGLSRIHREREKWGDLAAVLERLLEALDDSATSDEKLALNLELGVVLVERLGRPEQALRPLQEALALDATNRRALHALAMVHQASGQHEAHLATVEAELDAGATPAEALRYAEIAAKWEELGQLERAAACWKKLLAVEAHSEVAHQGRVRTLRRAERWQELADAHRAHLQVAFGVANRVEIMLALAADLGARPEHLDAAIGACHEALELQPDHRPALDELARCYVRRGRWKEALETLERLIARAPDARTKADAHQRIARIHVSRDEKAKALVLFERALDLDPANAAAHEGMARLHAEREDWQKAADHLRDAGQHHEDRMQAIGLLTEAGALYRDRLADLENAGHCLRRIVELEPAHAGAKEGLIETLSRAGQWAALWPHVSERAETLGGRDAYLQAARCALEIGKSQQAIALMDRAVALDPDDIPVLLERAGALCRTEAWDAAIKAYQSVLVQHAGALDGRQRVTAFRELALIHKRLGSAPQAFAYFRKVLEVDPRHVETLKELVELHLERAQFDEAVGNLRALAETVSPQDKPQVLERIGDLSHDKLKNPSRAASAYLEALDLDRANRRVLQKLLDLQSETGQWKAALETISRFLELESEPRKRGKYFLAMAAIRRFKAKEEAAALDDYQHALESFAHGSDPLDEATRASALEAFESLDEMLVAQKDWERQDRAHRLLIKRLPQGDAMLPKLWHTLGEIHRSRLTQYESAILAFETAHSLDPHKSPERVRILAELYALVGKQAPAMATDHAARLVDSDPDNPDTFRAMGKACLEAGRVDEAWCVSRALVYRKQATPQEEEFHRKYQAYERRKAKGVLDDDTWSHVRDDGEDRVVSSIFALTWEGPVALRAGPPKSFQLKSKERIKVESDTGAIGKIFQNASRVLNAPLPHVYAQQERPGRLLFANCIEDGVLAPAVIVARDLMAGYRDTEIVFCVANTLALLRPAWYLRLALPTVAELEAALTAAVGLVQPNVAVRPELAPMVEAFSTEMRKRMSPQTTEMLHALVKRLRDRPNLVRWRDAVDAAARRAGLLVCGELEAATRMVSSEPVLPDGPRPRDKVRDLVLFSVTPGYFAARRALGVTVA
jgi:golgin subfamily B member 1